jgi:hypothetical protein
MSTVEQRRFPLFVLPFVIFVIVSPVALWMINLFTARTYFVACFVWLLTISEVFVPTEPDAAWWRRLQWVKAGGWIVLAYIVFERVVAIVQ